jgi:hypothetical protein
MTGPLYIPITVDSDNPESGTETDGRFFSAFPTSTPKFARNDGPRRSEFVETMARFTIDVGRGSMQSLLDSLPADVQAAARTLLFDGNLTADDSFASGIGYFDFLLEAVTFPLAEREQAVDTLTDNTVIFYSGQSAPILSGQGTFMNTYQDDQHVWFQLLYAELLRGSALARRGLIARLTYDSFYMSGYLTSLQTSTQGGVKNAVNFSFGFRVKQVQIATPILYNPSTTTSRIQTALFESTSSNGANDEGRRGVQSTPAAVAERGAPITISIYDLTNIDARELYRQRSMPPRVEQRVTDATIVDEARTAAAALAAAPDGGAGLSPDPVAASGDVRAQLRPAEAAGLLSYTSPPVAVTPATTARSRFDATLSSDFRAADRSGSALISPVTGGEERSQQYADLIARQPPTEVTLDTRSRTAAVPLPPVTEVGGYQDIYRIHDTALASVYATQTRAGDKPLRLRSRRRARGLSTP